MTVKDTEYNKAALDVVELSTKLETANAAIDVLKAENAALKAELHKHRSGK